VAPKYIPREQFFAMKALRLLTKSAASQEMGVDVFALITVIACTEDAKRYTGPVNFHNQQLLQILGFAKWDRLDKARRCAVEHGWLCYLAPPKGERSSGHYWVTIPARLADVADGPCDETPDPLTAFYNRGYQDGKAGKVPQPYPSQGDARADGLEKAYPENGDTCQKAYPLKGDGSPEAYPLKGDALAKAYTFQGYGEGYAQGEPPNLDLYLNTSCTDPPKAATVPPPPPPVAAATKAKKPAQPKFDVEAVEFPYFPCNPTRVGGERIWRLPDAQLAELAELFPAVDIVNEAKRALRWCKDNPRKLKTPDGMKRFITNWMKGEQDRGGRNSPAANSRPPREISRPQKRA
jgi:hypothetical protein